MSTSGTALYAPWPLHRFQNMVIDRMVGIVDRVPPGDARELAPMFVS